MTNLEQALTDAAMQLSNELVKLQRNIKRLQHGENPNVVAKDVLTRLNHLPVNARFNQIALAALDDLATESINSSPIVINRSLIND